MEIKIKSNYSYDVKIQDINKQEFKFKYFICIDSRVFVLHKKKLENILSNAIDIIVIKATEDNKNMDSVNSILEMLNKNEATRSSVLMGIGGGIIGDISGFAASLYMRGIPYIQVPTTLLSQVDSSIGSKVGVNAFGNKNAIGSFYHPTKVIIDIDFLDTLSERLFKEGLVELIKHGFIKDKHILRRVEEFENIEHLRKSKTELRILIKKSLIVKKEVVKMDPNDLHERHILNYGHTFAHALELSEDVDLYHGEAVAIGMLVSAKLSENKEMYEKTKNIFEKFACLRPLCDVDLSKIKYDKKRQNDVIKEIILDDIGKPQIVEIPVNNLIKKYEEIYTKLKKENLKCVVKSYHIKARRLSGEVTIPPSKSYAHRYLIAAFLAQDNVVLKGFTELSNDVLVTISVIKQMGANVEYKNNCLYISSSQIRNIDYDVNMQESGTSLRLLMPLLMHFGNKVRITGENKLPTRPMNTYLEIFKEQNIDFSYDGKNYLPINIKSKLKPHDYVLDGDVSSQFLSGLLFTLPLLENDSTITLRTKLESLPYVKMTLDVLKEFGIKIKFDENYSSFKIKGNQKYVSKKEYTIEQDYSSRCFFEVAKALGNKITIKPDVSNTLQGDSSVLKLIKNNGYAFDLTDAPDAASIVSIYFTTKGGILGNTQRLKFKESDRLKAICDFLEVMNVGYKIVDDSLEIYQAKIKGGIFDTHNDHRILMSLAIASSMAKDDIIVSEIKSCEKSYYNFIEDFESLGGFIDEK